MNTFLVHQYPIIHLMNSFISAQFYLWPIKSVGNLWFKIPNYI